MIAPLEMPPELSAADATECLAGLATMEPTARAGAIEDLLRHSDPAVREAAVRAGAALLSADIQVAYLRNASDHILRNAGLAMLKARGAHAAPLALGLLHDRDPDVVLQAVLLLDHFNDPRSASSLRRVLHHHNLNVVQAVIVALGHVGDASVIPDLSGFLSSQPWLRLAAIEALGDLGCPEGIPVLARALADDELSPAVADAIARIGGVDAYRCLGARWIARGAADLPLLERLAQVIEAIPGEPPPFVSLPRVLAEALRTLSGAPRANAARALLAMGPTDADSAALDVVAAAMADQPAVPPCLVRRSDLIGALLRAPGARRGWGLRLAARWPMSTPRAALLEAVNALQSHEHADAVVDALLSTESDGIGTTLVSLYARLPRDLRANWSARLNRHAAAIRPALLERGTGRSGAARAVLATVTAQEPAAAAAAITALPAELREEALTHAAFRADVLPLLPWLRWLEESPETCGRFAVAVAERAGLAAHGPALRAMTERCPHADLIRLLGRIRDVESVPLLAALAESGPDTLRPFVLQSLGAIGGAAARAVLRARPAAEPAWARFAYRALAGASTADDLPVFRAAVRHADWHVRMVSVEVLGRSIADGDRALVARLAADPVEAVAARARAELGQ